VVAVEDRAGQLIAVVDDDESIREATTSLLRSNRFPAEAFSSAEEFLNSPSLVSTKCLLLDIGMPGMNGLELPRRLAGAGGRFPIIFITARDEPEIRLVAMRTGAVAFLAKPFSGSGLMKAISDALKPQPNENYDYSN
jgi:FixJ family two-component response regulator